VRETEIGEVCMKEPRFVPAEDELTKAVNAIQIGTVKEEILESRMSRVPAFQQWIKVSPYIKPENNA
jgi:hypothetical protein